MMKKSLLGISMALCSFTALAQMEVEAEMVKNYNGLMPLQMGVENVNDTLTASTLAGCDAAPRTYASGMGYISGTNTMGIVEIAQMMNLDSSSVDIYSLLVFVTNKEAGPMPGSFTGSIYSVDGSTLLPASSKGTTNPVTFANLDTVNTFTKFTFATPVSINNEMFYAALDVDNGSDTLSVATTGPNCAGGLSVFSDGTAWDSYANNFTAGGAALDPVIYIFVEVDNTVGLERNFISREGLEFYPNPVQTTATVKFDLPMENELSLSIQDISGREVYRVQKTFNGEERVFTFDVSNFQNGPYTYQVTGEKAQLNGVFVKK